MDPTSTSTPARNVVLVHGAWADGSSWSAVIARLQAADLRVTAVQNPLTSLADDVATTRRALALQDGPTVLAGHSYGGTVISEAGTDPRVTGLVYVAARGPEAGEDFDALAARYPTMPGRAGIATSGGFATLSEAAFLADFANGVPAAVARTLFAVQHPVAAGLFAARTAAAAWRHRPCVYLVSGRDRMTSPELQRFVARRMGARTVELEAGHLSPVSHPREVADAILAAARG